jgi:hypothetical protein
VAHARDVNTAQYRYSTARVRLLAFNVVRGTVLCTAPYSRTHTSSPGRSRSPGPPPPVRVFLFCALQCAKLNKNSRAPSAPRRAGLPGAPLHLYDYTYIHIQPCLSPTKKPPFRFALVCEYLMLQWQWAAQCRVVARRGTGIGVKHTAERGVKKIRCDLPKK